MDKNVCVFFLNVFHFFFVFHVQFHVLSKWFYGERVLVSGCDVMCRVWTIAGVYNYILLHFRMVSVFSGLVHILVVSFYVLGVGNVFVLNVCVYSWRGRCYRRRPSAALIARLYPKRRKSCAYIYIYISFVTSPFIVTTIPTCYTRELRGWYLN